MAKTGSSITMLERLKKESVEIDQIAADFGYEVQRMTEQFISVPRPDQQPQTTKLLTIISGALDRLGDSAEGSLSRAEVLHELLDELWPQYQKARESAVEACGEVVVDAVLPVSEE